MMVIDSSAILAILNDEPERLAFNEAIEQTDTCLISVVTFVETSMVLEACKGYEGVRDFDLFVAQAGMEITEVDVEQARLARDAFRQFGKGRHAASLNFGDCFSYALAKATGLPLLFKGGDFFLTDLERVV